MTWTELTAADGHTLAAFRIDPRDEPRGAVVVAEEIFGVNRHIQAMVAHFASLGYVAIAPALFDRVERNVDLGYDDNGFRRGRELANAMTMEGLQADMMAAVTAVSSVGRVAVVGYCFGGAVAWVAAASLRGLACVVSYYGSRIAGLRSLEPRVPVMMHVGRHDHSFPLETVQSIVADRPDVTLHDYDAGHGFNCDHRADFVPEAAALAGTRTLEFIAIHVG